MLKRLLALFSKKPSSQKTFEEKLERLKGESLADEIRRDDESLRRALHPGHTQVLNHSYRLIVLSTVLLYLMLMAICVTPKMQQGRSLLSNMHHQPNVICRKLVAA